MSWRRLALGAALAVAAAAWIFALTRLWRTEVPGLTMPRLDPGRLFSARELQRGRDFERFLAVDALLAQLALIVALAGYAARGARLARESAAGRVGTGMLLGMLGLGIVWLAQLPFSFAALWWQRHHGLIRIGLLEWLIDDFLALGGTFLFVCLALAVVMGLAGPLGPRWPLFGVPVLAGLAVAVALVQPWLVPSLRPLRDPALAADARALARTEGVSGVRVEVQEISQETPAPNAEAVGIGPARRVILWDTLLHGRFSRRELRVVLAHELAHHARSHIWKGAALLALLLVPGAFAVEWLTRRRGGLREPAAVPLALLVAALLALLVSPFTNAISRRYEREADWAALQATRDSAAARTALARLATASLSDPDPPGWQHALLDDHPTILQRLELVDAWRPRGARH